MNLSFCSVQHAHFLYSLVFLPNTWWSRFWDLLWLRWGVCSCPSLSLQIASFFEFGVFDCVMCLSQCCFLSIRVIPRLLKENSVGWSIQSFQNRLPPKHLLDFCHIIKAMITLTQEYTHLLVAQGIMCIYLSCVSLIPSLSFDDMFLGLQVLGLSPPLATGLILVSCCPGGQVSIHNWNLGGYLWLCNVLWEMNDWGRKNVQINLELFEGISNKVEFSVVAALFSRP